MSQRRHLRSVQTSVDDTDPVRATSRQRPCQHLAVVVDPRARTLECDVCHAVVDPYEALQMLSDNIARYQWAVDRARAEQRRADAQLAETRRLESNAKARARRAVAKLPACECGHAERHGYHGRAYWVFCPVCGGTLQHQ